MVTCHSLKKGIHICEADKSDSVDIFSLKMGIKIKNQLSKELAINLTADNWQINQGVKLS